MVGLSDPHLTLHTESVSVTLHPQTSIKACQASDNSNQKQEASSHKPRVKNHPHQARGQQGKSEMYQMLLIRLYTQFTEALSPSCNLTPTNCMSSVD